MYAPASILYRAELDAARVITTGSIRVNSVLVVNATASNVEVHFLNNAGTEILSIAVLAHDSFEFRAIWLADAGLNIQSASDANVSVVVAGTHVGM